MSYIQHDRNNEQMLVPITLVRGGTSRGFYFEGKNVPKPGEGLEELVRSPTFPGQGISDFLRRAAFFEPFTLNLVGRHISQGRVKPDLVIS